MDVLRETLAHYQIPKSNFRYLCTCRLAKRVWPDLPNHQLSTLATHIGHTFQHHQAQADAEAAGRVLLAIMAHLGVNRLEELLSKTGIYAASFIS
jgi:DNA polymerase-3 subunit epsilon